MGGSEREIQKERDGRVRNGARNGEKEEVREIDRGQERWKKQVGREWNLRKRRGKRDQVGRKIRNRREEMDREVEKEKHEERERNVEKDSDEWISWTVMVYVQLRLERKEWLALEVYMNRALLEQCQPSNP